MSRIKKTIEKKGEGKKKTIVIADDSDSDFVPQNNLLSDTIFRNFANIPFAVIENRKNGNCFFEAALDSAKHWLPTHHTLRDSRFFSNTHGSRRPKEDATTVRQHIANYIRAHTSNTPMTRMLRDHYRRSLKIIQKDKEWATTDEMHIFADVFNVLIILNSMPDGGSWTCIVPQGQEIDEMDHFIILRNLGTARNIHDPQGVAGIHYVALTPAGNINNIQLGPHAPYIEGLRPAMRHEI
tara:strand:+ start:27 stop:743 length:717 start_codon:yes stop_codon:yes gene_type:complete